MRFSIAMNKLVNWPFLHQTVPMTNSLQYKIFNNLLRVSKFVKTFISFSVDPPSVQELKEH